jgi:hypothetical protein
VNGSTASENESSATTSLSQTIAVSSASMSPPHVVTPVIGNNQKRKYSQAQLSNAVAYKHANPSVSLREIHELFGDIPQSTLNAQVRQLKAKLQKSGLQSTESMTSNKDKEGTVEDEETQPTPGLLQSSTNIDGSTTTDGESPAMTPSRTTISATSSASPLQLTASATRRKPKRTYSNTQLANAVAYKHANPSVSLRKIHELFGDIPKSTLNSQVRQLKVKLQNSEALTTERVTSSKDQQETIEEGSGTTDSESPATTLSRTISATSPQHASSGIRKRQKRTYSKIQLSNAVEYKYANPSVSLREIHELFGDIPQSTLNAQVRQLKEKLRKSDSQTEESAMNQEQGTEQETVAAAAEVPPIPIVLQLSSM